MQPAKADVAVVLEQTIRSISEFQFPQLALFFSLSLSLFFILRTGCTFAARRVRSPPTRRVIIYTLTWRKNIRKSSMCTFCLNKSAREGREEREKKEEEEEEEEGGGRYFRCSSNVLFPTGVVESILRERELPSCLEFIDHSHCFRTRSEFSLSSLPSSFTILFILIALVSNSLFSRPTKLRWWWWRRLGFSFLAGRGGICRMEIESQGAAHWRPRSGRTIHKGSESRIEERGKEKMGKYTTGPRESIQRKRSRSWRRDSSSSSFLSLAFQSDYEPASALITIETSPIESFLFEKKKKKKTTI